MGRRGVTAAQEAMWLAQEFAPHRPNNVVSLWDVDGDLDVPDLAAALRTIVGEAGALALNFRREDDRLWQIDRDLSDWEPFHADVSDAPDPAEAARSTVAALVAQPFDLAGDALLRAGTIRLGPGRHLVVLLFHHILTDAYGVLVLLSQRLAEVYRALRSGSPVPVAPARPAGDATEADEEYRSSARFAGDERFWRDYLAGHPAATQLPIGVRPTGDPVEAGPWDSLTGPLGMTTRTRRLPAGGAADLLAAAAAAYLQVMCGGGAALHTITVNHRTGNRRRSLGLWSNRVPFRAVLTPAVSLTSLARTLARERLAVLRHARHETALIKRATGLVAGERDRSAPLST